MTAHNPKWMASGKSRGGSVTKGATPSSFAPRGDYWDMVALMEYANTAALCAMVGDMNFVTIFQLQIPIHANCIINARGDTRMFPATMFVYLSGSKVSGEIS